jgi:2-polyprenyl-3-methyl-5-hydroxy-6-metoxy-1,4-benzoquinol methylase
MSQTKSLEFQSARPMSATPYLFDPVQQLAAPAGPGTRVLDVGCGNGYWSGLFADKGCVVVGIDPSASGIEVARETYPTARFQRAEVTEDLLERLGEQPFDVIVSTEVIEHLYDPPLFARACFESLAPGGRLVLSTPYHGRLKDIALAVSGHLERHHDALRVGGHIKFFTRRTLEQLLGEAGFVDFAFEGAGRLPQMWKSMVLRAVRPAS